MEPKSEHGTNIGRGRRNARLLASALADRFDWSRVSTRKKSGLILFVIGVLVLAMSFVAIYPGRWFWGLSGILAVIVGWVLARPGGKG
jgi:hypothetical protein